MKYLKLYNESKKDWTKMVNDLTFGYYNQIVQENNLSDDIEEVKDVVLPISDISEGTELFYDIYFDSKGFLPKQTTYITTPEGNKLVTNLYISELSTYSHWKEVSSKLNKIKDREIAWFGITLIFNQGKHYYNYSNETNKLKKTQSKKEFRDIKLGLESRGWTINQHGLDDKYLFTAAGEFCFSIVKPISIVLTNQWLISSGLLNESKLAIFENNMEQTRKEKLIEYTNKFDRLLRFDSEWLNNGWMSDSEKNEYEKETNKSEFIRKLWLKKANHDFFESLVKIHWIKNSENFEKLISLQKSPSELCCNGFYQNEEIDYDTWTNVGVILDGDVVFASNNDLETGWKDMKKMVSNTLGKSIALDKDTFLSDKEISTRNKFRQAGNELILTNFKIKEVAINNSHSLSIPNDDIKKIIELCNSNKIKIK